MGAKPRQDHLRRKGDKVRVKLTETAGTGYGWRLTTKPASAVLKFKRDLIKGRPDPGHPQRGRPRGPLLRLDG